VGFFLAGLLFAKVFARPSNDHQAADSVNAVLNTSKAQSAVRFALIRFALGVIGGAVCWGLLTVVESESIGMAVAVSLPVRIAAWATSIWFEFDRGSQYPNRILACTAIGVVWSYIMDVPSLFTFFSIAGRFLC
jgi:hypothetical protein